jgi:hypothetical protein
MSSLWETLMVSMRTDSKNISEEQLALELGFGTW